MLSKLQNSAGPASDAACPVMCIQAPRRGIGIIVTLLLQRFAHVFDHHDRRLCHRPNHDRAQ